VATLTGGIMTAAAQVIPDLFILLNSSRLLAARPIAG
jgi:hypothetical protein